MFAFTFQGTKRLQQMDLDIDLIFHRVNGTCSGPTGDGRSEFGIACDNGNVESIRSFIRNGAIVTPEEARCIAKSCNLDFVRELTSSLSSGSILDSYLTGACYANKIEVVDYLLDLGAKSDRDAFFACCRNGMTSAVKRIAPDAKTFVADGVSPVVMAGANGHTETVKALLDMGYSPELGRRSILLKPEMIEFIKENSS
jgi:ankyrin repeat protein